MWEHFAPRTMRVRRNRREDFELTKKYIVNEGNSFIAKIWTGAAMVRILVRMLEGI